MNTYFVLDDKGNSKIAPLKQIYRINAYLFIEGQGNATIDFITNIDSIWLSFEFKNYFYEISPIRDFKTDNELYQIHNLDITLRDYEKDSSVSTYKSDKPERQKESITLDTVHYPDLVLAGSVSFYNAYGSNWAAEMENIFDSSGDEDLYSMFYWNDIEWNLRRKFAFTSGGPSSNYFSHIFFKNYVQIKHTHMFINHNTFLVDDIYDMYIFNFDIIFDLDGYLPGIILWHISSCAS